MAKDFLLIAAVLPYKFTDGVIVFRSYTWSYSDSKSVLIDDSDDTLSKVW